MATLKLCDIDNETFQEWLVPFQARGAELVARGKFIERAIKDFDELKGAHNKLWRELWDKLVAEGVIHSSFNYDEWCMHLRDSDKKRPYLEISSGADKGKAAAEIKDLLTKLFN